MTSRIGLSPGPTAVGVVVAVVIVVATGGTGVAAVDDAVGGVQNATGSTLAALGGDAGARGPTAAAATLNERTLSRAIFRAVNDRRAGAGRDRLAWEPALHSAATAHSANMAANGYVGHVSPSGTTVADRYDRYGYRCRVHRDGTVVGGGETVLRLNASAGATAGSLAARAADRWFASDAHRPILLDDAWANGAVGVNVTVRGGHTVVYVTENLC